jgi:hypothetical protein
LPWTAWPWEILRFAIWVKVTILAFVSVMRTFETQRNGGNGVFEDLVLLEFLCPLFTFSVVGSFSLRLQGYVKGRMLITEC